MAPFNEIKKIDLYHSLMPDFCWPEIRVNENSKVSDLKQMIYTKTGTCPSDMVLYICKSTGNATDRLILDDDDAILKAYNVEDGNTIFINVTGSSIFESEANGDYENEETSELLRHYKTQLERVEAEGTEEVFERYKISDEVYNRREHGLRDFINKMREKNGTLEVKKIKNDDDDDLLKLKQTFPLESRCLVSPGDCRGTIKFVGKVMGDGSKVKIGVHLDEPLGNCNGTRSGILYFECPDKYGGFFKPEAVTVGDYPELDVFDLV
ncbi:bifunctional CAP Gly-rich domain superfamily/CAP Gly-rich domain/Ubiquitin-like domain/Ubiquitin-like domain superfamily [Babesia duncani]|uniref:Bifunctional CAP Gly-rich domain superfamily/CAP Gly-rich domain/Ubiquitin-like domain/Ubiquitin-like domain superfamily n=1 Tax=Babesia duncani TaxID=323732 RepID=A0AAD9UPR3_9APIC|nr:bifunctional CAP Gly-rich domain superfamily/CAP Gly-rich domain/Ubiquitin-like domain/Ubiquitin-like domain superfamily [Babesia duncani]